MDVANAMAFRRVVNLKKWRCGRCRARAQARAAEVTSWHGNLLLTSRGRPVVKTTGSLVGAAHNHLELTEVNVLLTHQDLHITQIIHIFIGGERPQFSQPARYVVFTSKARPRDL
jgi:hypothetical protein